MTTNIARLHILQHALGLDTHGQGRSYRNHFVTGPGGTDHGDCMALVAAGLMTPRGGSSLTGGDELFTVTDAGRTVRRTEQSAAAQIDASAGALPALPHR